MEKPIKMEAVEQKLKEIHEHLDNAKAIVVASEANDDTGIAINELELALEKCQLLQDGLAISMRIVEEILNQVREVRRQREQEWN